jgi:cyanate lyase
LPLGKVDSLPQTTREFWLPSPDFSIESIGAAITSRSSDELKLAPAAAAMLTEPPEDRGANLKMPPSDPSSIAIYEIVQGYGPTLKALINDEFGDGIMSAIDFTMNIEREADPKVDRVKITSRENSCRLNGF